MRKILLAGFVICVVSIFSFAQKKPFSTIDEFLTNEGGSFDNRKEIVALFNEERAGLGKNFEAELWKYLGSIDLEKYYWISAFLEEKEYLQNALPLPALALEIKIRGAEIPVDKDDVQGLGMKATLWREAAVDSYLAGARDRALKYKKQSMEIIENNNLAEIGVMGATTEYRQCIFDNLEKGTSICKKDAP